DRGFRLVVSDSWLAGLFRTQILARIAAFAMRRLRVRRFAFRTVSQIGIHYREGSLSQTLAGLPDKAPQAGDRFPWLKLKRRPNGAIEDLFAVLDDTRFHLLAIGQPAPVDGALDFADLIEVHEIPDDAANRQELAARQIPQPSFYLL